MKRTSFVAFLLSFAALVGCEDFKKGYDQGYCKSFGESFVKTCNDACVGKGGAAAACEAGCKAELPKQESYAKRCLKN